MLFPLMFGTLGLPELLIILFIVFLIFGASKLPQLGAGLGEGIKNFKRSINEWMRSTNRPYKANAIDEGF